MKVEEAVRRVKSHLLEVFADENLSEVRLEEVEFDEKDEAWLITLSAVRPGGSDTPLAAFITRDQPLKRTYRVIRILDDGSGIPSIKVRSFILDDQ